MAVDTRDKRASVIGIGLPFLAILPQPEGSVLGADRTQLAYAYRLVDIGGIAIIVRRITDYAGLTDQAFRQRAHVEQVVDSTGLTDQFGFTRFRSAFTIDTLEVDDAVLRFIQLPGVTIILRQVTDSIGLSDMQLMQRFLAREIHDTVAIVDLAEWVRFREQLGQDGLTIADALTEWRERGRAGIDWLDASDLSITQREFTRQVGDTVLTVDRILRLYYPYLMNYERLCGVHIDAHRVYKTRVRANVMGVIATGGRSSTGHMHDLLHRRKWMAT